MFERRNWCWLLGHVWKVFYPSPEADSPISDVTPVTYCTICDRRR